MLYNVDNDNCLDYVYALLNLCGYLIFPRFMYRKRIVAFCSYKKQMECKFDLVLFKAGTENPVVFVMSSPSLVDGIPNTIAAAVALHRHYYDEVGRKVSAFLNVRWFDCAHQTLQIPAILVVKNIIYLFKVEITPGLLKCIEHGTRPHRNTLVDVYSSRPQNISAFASQGSYANEELPDLSRLWRRSKNSCPIQISFV